MCLFKWQIYYFIGHKEKRDKGDSETDLIRKIGRQTHRQTEIEKE